MAAAVALAVVTLGALPAAAAPPVVTLDDVKLEHGLTRYELSVPAGRLASRNPLVVLVAGYAVPMVVWTDTVPALLAKDFSVLRFDFYGRGRSARPHVAYAPDLFADQLRELVATLELPAKFHVVASSMGSIVTAVFANRHPDVLDRVVLVSPAGLSEKFPSMITLFKVPAVGPWYFRHSFKGIMLEHLQENLAIDYRNYPDVLAEFRWQLTQAGSADAMYSTLRRTLLRDSRDDFRGLGGLHRPTRVLWGTRDRLVPFRDSRKALKSAIPHHELCAVTKAAHLPQVERWEQFNPLVAQFLSAQPDEPLARCDARPLERKTWPLE